MPCYQAWFEHLTKGTPEYAEARRNVEIRLAAVKHIIDYYYQAYGHPLPALPENTVINECRQPRSRREFELRKIICHHFLCDGINVTHLYDVASILDDSKYLAVVLPCANLIRFQYHTGHLAPLPKRNTP